MAKTITEINEKIRRGQAVVVTAEEILAHTAVSCADLKSGKITLHDKEVPTAFNPLKERPVEE